MSTIAAVAGASGYAGGEILRLLLTHPEIEIGPIAAASKAGRAVGEVHPQLVPLADRPLVVADPDAFAGADIVFLALPHGESAALVGQLAPAQPVVDLGADFRLTDPGAWETFYGGEHAGHWTYGMPELDGAREAIASSTRVANPGCYPTSVILAMAPLLAAGLVEPLVIVVAASGTSGAGRTPKENLLASEVMGSMSAYKVGGTHQHTPEIEQALSQGYGDKVHVSFTPLLAPMPRGILSTCSAAIEPGTSAEDIRDCLHAAYAAEPFVHLLSEGAWPQTAATAGSNSLHLQVAVDARTGRAIVVSALDNLGKGAAGQAVQNANLMLGLPETAGLSSAGVAP